MSHTSQLLQSLKKQKLSLTQYNLIKTTAFKQSLKSINLWHFKPQIRTLFKMAKFQSYMMVLFGFAALPYILYTKYQQDKQKLMKIVIFAPIGITACMGPLILYKRFSKKLVESIGYCFEKKKIQMVRFSDGKIVEAEIKDLKFTKSDKGRVKQLLWSNLQGNVQNKTNSIVQSNKKFQIQGLGQWESMQLFEFLIKNPQHEAL